MGRDALFDLLAVHGLLVRKKRRTTITTNSKHWFRRYPNLVRGFTPCGINQLWVSDITYWKAKQQFFYISFITDAYSRKIVGYSVAENMESVHCRAQALKIALCGLRPQGHFKLTHHSDRGLQYCSNSYVQLLNENNITISMTENGDPLENALAERINGIIKDEYLQFCKPANIIEAKAILKRTVKLYNQQRPHMSIGNLTPEQIHCNINLKTEKLWKNYYHSKPNFEHPKITVNKKTHLYNL
ncbi:MAG: IS3 family transposase [Chitinophagaceae bacterium]|nr:IS3 family transposase [Chitinophagaceae bacterium]